MLERNGAGGRGPGGNQAARPGMSIMFFERSAYASRRAGITRPPAVKSRRPGPGGIK